MRVIFLICAILLLFLPAIADELDSASNTWDSINSQQIENPFFRQKPVTDQQFEKTINEIKNRNKRTGWWIFKKKEEKPLSDSVIPPSEFQYNELQPIFNAVKYTTTVMIPTNVVNSEGQIIPTGFYKLSLQKQEPEKYYLLLSQGTKLIARVEAHKTDENFSEYEMSTAKALLLQDKIKLIYANVDLNLEGYLDINK